MSCRRHKGMADKNRPGTRRREKDRLFLDTTKKQREELTTPVALSSVSLPLVGILISTIHTYPSLKKSRTKYRQLNPQRQKEETAQSDDHTPCDSNKPKAVQRLYIFLKNMDPLLLPGSGLKTVSDDEEEEDVEEIPLNDNETWKLRVKSLKDVSVLVRPRDTIASVKEAVRRALGPEVTRDRPYTRLVCKGRLLAPDAALLKDLPVVQPDDVVHAVLSASAPREGPQAALQRGLMMEQQQHSSHAHNASSSSPTSNTGGGRLSISRSSRSSRDRHNTIGIPTSSGPSRRLRGAGINAAGLAVRHTADSEDDEDNDDEESVEEDVENGGWMGFDRLRRAGLRRSDVLALRTYFGRSIDRFVRQNPEQTAFAGETDLRRRRLLQEEAWMAAQGPLSEFRLNITPMAAAGNTPWATGGSGGGGGANGTTAGWNNATNARGSLSPSEALWRSGGLSAAVGTDRDFIWGFVLGFLVGLLMLVWVWMPSVPHKQKLGILTGICFQLALSMLRTSGGVEESPYPIYEGDDVFFQD